MNRTHQPFDLERPVQVYFNSRPEHRCWSVRQRGRVVGHADFLVLRDVTWRVQPSGRERVRREGKKNVHAYASGWVTHLILLDGTEQAVRYNPYELETFVVGNNQPLLTSRFAVFKLNDDEDHDDDDNQPRTWACGINL